MGNGAINLAGILFSLASLVHLARIFCPFQVMIGSFVVPEWASYAGFFFFGVLAFYLFRSRHLDVQAEKK